MLHGAGRCHGLSRALSLDADCTRADRGLRRRHRAGSGAPAGGRPIVAWAHPTTGVMPRCAPSLALFRVPANPGTARNDRSRLLSSPRPIIPASAAADPSLSGRSERSARRARFGARGARADRARRTALRSGAIRRAGKRLCSPVSSPASTRPTSIWSASPRRRLRPSLAHCWVTTSIRAAGAISPP